MEFHKLFQQGKLGVVVLRVKKNANDITLLNYRLAKIGGYVENSTNYEAPWHHEMLYLEPGTYYIDSIQIPSRDLLNYSSYITLSSPGYKKSYIRGGIEIKYGAFEVRAGEVLTLGTLIVGEHRDELIFVKEHDEIKNHLTKIGRDDLSSKARPGVFHEAGSVVFASKGKMQWLDKNVTTEIQEKAWEDAINNAKKNRDYD